jgi:hypothetical protein
VGWDENLLPIRLDENDAIRHPLKMLDRRQVDDDQWYSLNQPITAHEEFCPTDHEVADATQQQDASEY